jgi:RNA polymerase sigma-70 factor (sigma-E family)
MTVAEPTFDDYVASRGAALLRLAFMLSGDRHLAEDLTQDVLIKVYDRWSRVGRMEQPDAYVRRMLVNSHVSWRRRKSSTEVPVENDSEDAAGAAAVADAAEDMAEREQAWQLLATLPRRQQAVLVLRIYEDLSDPEIAAALGCTQSTVRSQAARALATLRGALQTPNPVRSAGKDS